jgi:hypothetical protein
MSTWKPISKNHLEGLIDVSEYEMSSSQRIVWEKVRLPSPEKWVQSPMGDEGGGFWVVAVFGCSCLYYNDIEDGFNQSKFSTWGVIDEYCCNQLELHHFIASVFSPSS